MRWAYPGVKSTAEIDAQMNKRKHDLLAEDNGKINWARIAGEVLSPINYVGGALTSDAGWWQQGLPN